MNQKDGQVGEEEHAHLPRWNIYHGGGRPCSSSLFMMWKSAEIAHSLMVRFVSTCCEVQRKVPKEMQNNCVRRLDRCPSRSETEENGGMNVGMFEKMWVCGVGECAHCFVQKDVSLH